MRITRETLLKLAREMVNQQVHDRHDLVSVFLIGSLLYEDALLGGSTDIDLVFIHDRQPEVEREIIRLSPEITFDMTHQPQTDYSQPRHLRLHPWIGPAIRDSHIVFHDTQHWFEFTQASVSSQFYLPENVYGRARQEADRARQIWLDIQANPDQLDIARNFYLKAIESASNAAASLSGSPLTERRFLVKFPERAQAINQPGLTQAVLALIGADQIDGEQVQSWLPAWRETYQATAGSPTCSIRLKPERQLYYEHAIQALLESPTPAAAVWPLLTTWTEAMVCQPVDATLQTSWATVCRALHLGADEFSHKLEALDAYLDRIDEILENWAKNNGIG